MKIRAIEFNQHGKRFYLAAMKAKDLVSRYKVDVWTPENDSGYQRVLSASRVKSFARFVMEKGISPLSILLNIRDVDKVRYENDHLILPDDITLWVVDGQHRLEGLKEAIQTDASLKEFEIPVVIMQEREVYEEAKQFVIINRTQKGVRSDLAERFLQKMVEEEGRRRLIEQRDRGILREVLRGIEWKYKAIKIVDELNTNEDSPWKDLIRLPNTPRGKTIIAQKSFMDSLQPILTDAFFETKDENLIAKALINYWNAIKELCREAFEDPEEYVIQKTTGVFVLHKIFPKVTEYCVNEKGRRVLTKEKFKEVLRRLGDAMRSEYWHRQGEAGLRGTSQKTFNLLAQELKERLEVEESPLSRQEIVV